jgi:hypothetical protein
MKMSRCFVTPDGLTVIKIVNFFKSYLQAHSDGMGGV